MKRIVCTLMVICVMMSIGCTNQSADDAASIDSSRAEAQANGGSGKNMNDAATTATMTGLDEVVWVNGKSVTVKF